MQKPFTPNLLHWFIASVWLVNGLFCKVLNMVPRHQQIVATILGNEQAKLLTVLIGIAEIAMAIWIISGVHRRLNAFTQIFIIAAMNALEFFLAPGLLLWGRTNALYAILFIGLIYYNEFRPFKKLTRVVACSLL